MIKLCFSYCISSPSFVLLEDFRVRNENLVASKCNTPWSVSRVPCLYMCAKNLSYIRSVKKHEANAECIFNAPYIRTKFFAHIYSPGTSEARQRVINRGNGGDNEVDIGAFHEAPGRGKAPMSTELSPPCPRLITS